MPGQATPTPQGLVDDMCVTLPYHRTDHIRADAETSAVSAKHHRDVQPDFVQTSRISDHFCVI